MADRVTPGPVNSMSGVREAVCIHTKKIYSSCRDKDCIEDLRFYPTQSARDVLASAQGIRGGSAELLYTFVDVEPVNFNRGFYTVDMRFYYKITLQALNGSTRYTEVDGLATFGKRVILCGGESGPKIFSSEPVADELDRQLDLTADLPTAFVEVIDPLLLSANFADNCHYMPGVLSGVPEGILAAFNEPLVLDEAQSRRVCVSLGQFSIVRLERDTQLLVPVYDYCIPTEECTVAGIGSAEDPCSIFADVDFPVNSFFPSTDVCENGVGGAGDGCGCKARDRD